VLHLSRRRRARARSGLPTPTSTLLAPATPQRGASAVTTTKKAFNGVCGKGKWSPATFLVDSGLRTALFSLRSSAWVISIFGTFPSPFGRRSTQTASMKTTVHPKIQGHKTSITCYILDMQEQFYVVLGDTWLHQTSAVMDYGNMSCTVVRKGHKRVYSPCMTVNPPNPRTQFQVSP